MSNILKLTDTHLLLLSAAAQRSDGLLDLGARLKGNSLRVAGEKLLKADLVTETTVEPDQPAWRTDENDVRIGLKITQPGLLAIALEADEAQGDLAAEPATEVALVAIVADGTRPGTKRALIIALLSREEGASISDLMTATGWLPHTTRAALTGLRKQGHVLAKTPGADGKTAYRISTSPAATIAA